MGVGSIGIAPDTVDTAPPRRHSFVVSHEEVYPIIAARARRARGIDRTGLPNTSGSWSPSQVAALMCLSSADPNGRVDYYLLFYGPLESRGTRT
jgi:hypothetical protein